MDSLKLAVSFAIVLVVFVLTNIQCHELSRMHFEESIPVEFEIVDTLFSHEEIGCGLAIFKLSDTTVSKITSEKLEFFKNATTARVLHKYGYNHYAEWNETPVPKRWYSEGSWFACGEHNLLRSITDAGISAGAYYSSSNGEDAKFVVVPTLGVIVYSYFD